MTTPYRTELHARSAAAQRAARAFTLIELLTVIGIIAILVAILLPVFASVRESTRRGTTISNMQQIYSGLRQYELDNRRYPDYLLGPAIKASGANCTLATNTADSKQYLQIAAPGDTACSLGQAAATGKYGGSYAADSTGTLSPLSGGLYPEYVKDLSAFSCPNNDIADTAGDVSFATVPRVNYDKTGGNTTLNVPLYRYDSFDANPKINPTSRQLTSTFQTRYSRLWQNVTTGTTVSTSHDYKDQLFWRAPGADAYVTMVTYHVPKGKVIVLFLNGAAKVWDVSKLTNLSQASSNPNIPNITGTNGNDYDMYKLTPNN